MIDFSKIETPPQLNKGFILSKISQEQIFFYYYGAFVLNKVQYSKLRRDKKPSVGFYINNAGNITYHDFATGEKYDCFNYVITLHRESYKDALLRICKDFGLINGKEPSEKVKLVYDQSLEFDREAKAETLIQIIRGEWTSERLAYWKQYCIPLELLIREEVYAVDRLWVNKTEHKIDHLCFAYIVREKGNDKMYVKIYQPYSDRMKWLSNVPLVVPFGLDKLVYGTDHLLIGKAQKDRLILLMLFSSVIGTQNESESALSKDIIKHLCWNFPRRTIIWDADRTGVENCMKFNDKGFGYFNTPKELLELGIKDISDYVKTYGLHALEKLLKTKNIL